MSNMERGMQEDQQFAIAVSNCEKCLTRLKNKIFNYAEENNYLLSGDESGLIASIDIFLNVMSSSFK